MTASVTDFTQFTGLRSAAQNKDPAVLREVAGQFEALFLQTMLKNMREASLGDPLFGNSDQHEMYQSMMDEQLALEMASGKGIGLADMLVRQLGGGEAAPMPSRSTSLPIAARDDVALKSEAWQDPESFVRDIWPHAQRAARRLNVAAEAIVAHAALETGWGAHVMPDADGGNSFNLFGIKADPHWSGDRVSKQTLEFEHGIPQQQTASFRAYGDVAKTFADYAEFLGKGSRYSRVRNTGADAIGFATALQDSGYATDPNYAAKVTSVLHSPTMRRAMAALGE